MSRYIQNHPGTVVQIFTAMAHTLTDTYRVIVITAGVSTFIWCKRDIDRRRLEVMKSEQREKYKKRLTIGNAARHN